MGLAINLSKHYSKNKDERRFLNEKEIAIHK